MSENGIITQSQSQQHALVPIESVSTAVAAQVDAALRARYALALQRPRDLDNVRAQLLKDCSRPRFAESARYSIPRGGKKIEGPSIRFAEAAARALGNLSIESVVIHDDPERRMVRISVVDVEINLPFSQDIVVDKFIERQQLKQGQSAISSRMNSSGRVVYRVEADEGELLVKQAALTSKAVRTLVLRLLPGDVLEDAMDACVATLSREDAKDPLAARKKILDGFASVGVSPSELKLFVGGDLEYVNQEKIAELRALYQAIRDGETTWAAVMDGHSKKDLQQVATEAPKTLDELAVKKKAQKKISIKGPDGEAIIVQPEQAAKAKQRPPTGTQCNECGEIDDHMTVDCPNVPTFG